MFTRASPSSSAFPYYMASRLLHCGFEACSAFAYVTARTLAKSPLRPSTPKASAASSPPPLLRMLPGGSRYKTLALMSSSELFSSSICWISSLRFRSRSSSSDSTSGTLIAVGLFGSRVAGTSGVRIFQMSQDERILLVGIHVLNDFGYRVSERVGLCAVIFRSRHPAHPSEAAHVVNVDHVHAVKRK